LLLLLHSLGLDLGGTLFCGPTSAPVTDARDALNVPNVAPRGESGGATAQPWNVPLGGLALSWIVVHGWLVRLVLCVGVVVQNLLEWLFRLLGLLFVCLGFPHT
jgi:hypothetical protein